MNELFKIMFGEFTVVELLGYAWFMFIGFLINFLLDTTGRDKESKKTPKKWSFKFLLYDNWKRIITSILCTYVLFRFYNEISGHPFSNFDAIVISLIGDGASVIIKKRIKGMGIDDDRRRYMDDDRNDRDRHEERYYQENPNVEKTNEKDNVDNKSGKYDQGNVDVGDVN